jgi:predicted SprT family Zn-dependent metalloprotease
MRIKVEGSQNFVAMIIAFHETLWPKVANRFPHLQKLEDKTIWVYETTSITDMGISFLDRWEILIQHYFTKNNPKLLYEVYGHELAHFMATHGDGNATHSGSWVTYMKAMELPVRDAVPISPELSSWGKMAIIKCGCSAQEIQKSSIAPQMKCGRCHKVFKII